MKILVALDGSGASEAVLAEVRARAWPAGSEFSLVTALDPFFFAHAQALFEEAKKADAAQLEEEAEELRKLGWKVQTSVVVENPRRGLAHAAGSWGADLIVLGSHGRGAFQRLLLGSTAQAVLRQAPCSVEIVRPPRNVGHAGTAHGKRVLVPTDGSEYAQLALNSVAEGPWAKDTHFKVISCPEFPMMVGEYPYFSTEQLMEMSRAAEVQARKAAEAGAEILHGAGLAVRAEVMEPRESAAQTILLAADLWHAELIVLGSHGRRGFDRLVMGSVSEAVAIHAHCSVEVVRKRAATQPS